MRRYTDSNVSSFLDGVAFDQTAGFLNKWNEGRSRGEKIYISYDSTNKNRQAGGPGDRRVWQGQGRCQDTGRKGRRGKGKGTPLKGSGCAEVIAEQTGRNAKEGVDAGDCGQRQNLRGNPSFHQELRKSQSSSWKAAGAMHGGLFLGIKKLEVHIHSSADAGLKGRESSSLLPPLAVSTCFSPKQRQIIVRVREDCDDRFSREQPCPIVKHIIPIPASTCASSRRTSRCPSALSSPSCGG